MIRPRVLGNHWRQWRDAHGIKLTIHELRHTFITYSRIKTDLELAEFKRLIGHSRTMDTDRIYAHRVDKSLGELAAEKVVREHQSATINAAFSAALDTVTHTVTKTISIDSRSTAG